MTRESESDAKEVEQPNRQYDTDHKRKWVCPDCGHEEKRHHATKQRPFCDPCDSQHAVLVEMEPFKNGDWVSLDVE